MLTHEQEKILGNALLYAVIKTIPKIAEAESMKYEKQEQENAIHNFV